MLSFLKSEAELVPVESDPEVMEATGALCEAVAELERLEAREKRMIDIVTDRASRVTQAEDDEAREQLAIRKGTQSAWFLPEADESRRLVAALRITHGEAVQRAKARLVEAGTVRLKALCGELQPVLAGAMEIAKRIEALRQEVGQGGAALDEHPCSCLLPGSLVAGQLDLMRKKGLM